MSNFSRAFELAWERMMVILFRPFDLGKWFTIGFSAFLAGLLSGGNGFNGSYNPPTKTSDFTPSGSFHYYSNVPSLPGAPGGIAGVNGALSFLSAGFGIFLAALIFFAVVGVMLLILWLGARGQFLLLDNVVRNRGAIAWPWRTYARPGNDLFRLYVLCVVLGLVVLVPLTVLGVMLALPWFQQNRWPAGVEVAGAAVLVLAYLAFITAWSVTLFLFQELGVPLMFRNGISARAAFGETWRLVRRRPGKIFLFVLLRIALFFGLAIVSVIACCLTCCVGALPYLGTVAILPALIYVKCFTLDCLAQFGPEYDVWTTDVPPPPAAPVVASSPPPPPG
jgi:hypothetical protein